MARQPRVDISDEVYHVINRSNARWRIFKSEKDYQNVLDSLEETLELIPISIYSFCIMPNHWHFAVKPHKNGDLGKFFGKFTQKLTQRWHASHNTAGSGHLFQGRFKSFLVEKDSYFFQLMIYIEANPLRAKMVKRAEDWQWSSLYLRITNPAITEKLLTPWLINIPDNYLKLVNLPLQKEELKNIRHAVLRGSPLGNQSWINSKVKKYDLQYTIRREGRPNTK